MKVFVVNPIHPDAVALLRRHAEAVTWDQPEVKNWREEADGMVVRGMPVDRAGIEVAVPRLKVVARHGVGYDNVDLPAATEHGIVVTNTPGANTNAVVEMTIGMAINVGRRIPFSHRSLRAGERGPGCDLRGFELSGRTAGIVGVGNIGSRVAAALHRGFGMKVIGYDPLLTDARWAELSGVVGRRDDLLAMLGEADLVALHCPLDAVTRNMIDREALAAMRPHAILLGASRGGVIDEAALYDALVAGQIAGAGLDVFADEPTPQDHPLLSLDSVVAAPHLGGMSEQGMIAMGVTAVEEVLRVLRGEGPRHRVN